MLHEYAVEPRAIGTNWQTFLHVIEKFGFDRGRLISEFPKKRWFREVYRAAEDWPHIDRKRLEVTLKKARERKVVRYYGRAYNQNESWRDNALAEHQREPFHAILAAESPGNKGSILQVDDDLTEERYPIMRFEHTRRIPRDVESLAACLYGMMRFGNRIVFVDPFFDPYKPGYKKIFLRLLSIVKELNPQAICEVHYRYHEKKPDNSDLARDDFLFKKIVPDGVSLTIYCWREKKGGEDFHARYLLVEQGGISIDAGFDPVGAHQTTDVSLMSLELSRTRLAMFAREATTYELIGPVLEVSADGSVKHI